MGVKRSVIGPGGWRAPATIRGIHGVGPNLQAQPRGVSRSRIEVVIRNPAYINFRRLNACTSAAASANHSPLRRYAAVLLRGAPNLVKDLLLAHDSRAPSAKSGLGRIVALGVSVSAGRLVEILYNSLI
jgi:hypothetical protein